jgi:hypothetical protein
MGHVSKVMVKDKVVHVMPRRHTDERRFICTFNLGSEQRYRPLHAPVTLTPGKESLYQLDRTLGRFQAKQQNSCLFQEFK